MEKNNYRVTLTVTDKEDVDGPNAEFVSDVVADTEGDAVDMACEMFLASLRTKGATDIERIK